MNGKDLITLVEYLNSHNKTPKGKKMKTETDFVSRLKRINEEKELLEKYLLEMKVKEMPKGFQYKPTFAEGLILMYFLQILIPIGTKLVSAHLGISP